MICRGFVYEWFTPIGLLKDDYKGVCWGSSSQFQRGIQNSPILFLNHEVELLIITSLKAHIKVGQPLYAWTVRSLIISTSKKKKKKKPTTTFCISLKWVRRYGKKNEQNWMFWKSTTTTSKLPKGLGVSRAMNGTTCCLFGEVLQSSSCFGGQHRSNGHAPYANGRYEDMGGEGNQKPSRC